VEQSISVWTVLGKEQYVLRNDTVCVELYCNIIQCVLKCTVTLYSVC